MTTDPDRPEPTGPTSGPAPDETPDAAAGHDGPLPEGLEIPDDLSELTGARKDPELAVLITQIAGAEPLAAACALAELDVDVAPTPVGALAVLRDTSDDAPDKAATAISRLVAGVPLVLVTRWGEQLTCVRYADGAAEGELPPGLVLGGAPEALEDVLTGQLRVTELPGVVASSGIGRFKAMRMLSGAARKARKSK
ncbi:hypothetical protein [Isoptericola cucumis]|uniref:Uncharacterized protein n=1 Tax=Isoptericola cucumis TaxID=1776856 RepID=A0ABQ2B4U6_9MICO|nr:hypothetical protein [Isoptericola cucumis]GGI07987.1 hypothetical protein GCM10007368_18920 [Isoptericola cucumis]